MDQQFPRMTASRLQGRAIALDYAQLIAALAAQQSASLTGIAATLLASPRREVLTPPQALAALFTGAPGWAGAVAALCARFHPGVRCQAASMTRQQG